MTRLEKFSHWKLPEFTEEEKKANLKTADFFGLNFYNGNLFIGFDKTGIIRSAIDTYLEINGQEKISKALTSQSATTHRLDRQLIGSLEFLGLLPH